CFHPCNYYHQMVRTVYCVIDSSGVRIASPWTIDWQINMRSNGSACRRGKRAPYSTDSSSNASVAVPYFSLKRCTKAAGGSGSGSRPMAYLVEISQHEMTLRKTS